jgi:hypothetical protein
MPKNIIVCSDGTGNTAIKGRGTNVFKLYESLDLTHHHIDPNLTPQIAFYDDGVGTQRFAPLKLLGGMTGFGLSRNVKNLYKEIVRVYDPGDAIYMFGFSRGAFTVRTLAGLIADCGLLDPSKIETASKLNSAVDYAYGIHRQHYRPKLWELIFGKPNLNKPRLPKEIFHNFDVPIKFIGVWDTVDAVGLPFHAADLLNAVIYRFKFPDQRLSDIVEHAAHALSVDDARISFTPVLWDESMEKTGRIEQVWFSGAHSNVGGGYPKQGMSLVALDWMMDQAERAGLRFLPGDRAFYREHANVDDKLYDPRRGLGAFYRWQPRKIHSICSKAGVEPRLHVSVLERVAHGTESYAPGNLPKSPTVCITKPPSQSSELLEERARRVAQALREHPDLESLLPQVQSAIVMAKVSYYTYPAVSAFMLTYLLLRLRKQSSRKSTPKKSTLKMFSIPFIGFGLAYLLQVTSEEQMSAVFSRFWHGVQPELGKALKQAQQNVKGKAA